MSNGLQQTSNGLSTGSIGMAGSAESLLDKQWECNVHASSGTASGLLEDS